MDDMHEAIFVWPELDHQDVILTGTFDQWSSSIHMTKTPRGFEGKVKLPWNSRVLYKFIIDGQWSTAPSYPVETDSLGNVNNVYECPPKPEALTLETLPVDLSPESEEKPEHNTAPEVSMPGSFSVLPSDQPTSPEQTFQADRHVQEPAIISVHVNTVSPIVETNHKEANSTNDVDPVKQDPQVAVIAAQITSTTDMTDIIARTNGVPKEPANVITPKEETDEPSGTEPINAITGIDPLHVDKIPVVTPTAMQEGLVAESHPLPATQPVSSPELDIDSRSKSVRAADAVPESKEIAPHRVIEPVSTTAPPAEPEPTPSPLAELEPTPEPLSKPEPTPPPSAEQKNTAGEPDPRPPSATEPEPTLAPAEPELRPSPLSEPEPTPEPLAKPESAAAGSLAEHTIASASEPEPTPAPQGNSGPTLEPLIDPEPTPTPHAKPEPEPASPAPVTVESDDHSATNIPSHEPHPAEQYASPTSEVGEGKDNLITLPQQPATTSDGPTIQPVTEEIPTVQPAEPVSSPSLEDISTNGVPPNGAGRSHSLPTTVPDTKAAPIATDTLGKSSQTGSIRKKRVSFFGKVKNLFHSDKEVKKERK